MNLKQDCSWFLHLHEKLMKILSINKSIVYILSQNHLSITLYLHFKLLTNCKEFYLLQCCCKLRDRNSYNLHLHRFCSVSFRSAHFKKLCGFWAGLLLHNSNCFNLWRRRDTVLHCSNRCCTHWYKCSWCLFLAAFCCNEIGISVMPMGN